MAPSIRKPIACVLIVLLAIISGVSEGLHWIPGCGHGVTVGDSVVWLGIDRPDAESSMPIGSQAVRSQEQKLPIYNEDQCVICSVVAHGYTSTHSISMSMVATLVQDLPPAIPHIRPATSLRPTQARAPPLV